MNNEVKESMPIQDEGIRYTVSVNQPQVRTNLSIKYKLMEHFNI